MNADSIDLVSSQAPSGRNPHSPSGNIKRKAVPNTKPAHTIQRKPISSSAVLKSQKFSYPSESPGDSAAFITSPAQTPDPPNLLKHASNSDHEVPPHSEFTPPNNALPQAWRPVVLRRRIIAAFLLVWLALFAGIEAMHQISEANHGIATSSNNAYYLWTYGPTAVFTVVATLWMRVDYRSRQMAPWLRMSGHFLSCKQTLLLDYVSTSPPVTIIRSLRNKDVLVALPTLGTVIFQISIVISTGLLSSSNLAVKQENVSLSVSGNFIGNTERLRSIGSLPYYIYQGVFATNLTYPNGTNAQYAYQTLSGRGIRSGAVLSAAVDAFTADLECEPGNLQFGEWSVDSYHGLPSSVPPQTKQNINISASSCSMNQMIISSNVVREGNTDYFGNFYLKPCTDHATRINDTRVLIWTGRYLEGQSLNVTENSISTTFTVVNSTALICKPTYTINKAMLTTNYTEKEVSTLELVSHAQNRTLEGVNAMDLADVIFGYTSGISYYDWNYQLNVTYVGFLNLAMRQHNVTMQSDMLLPDVLESSSRNFYRSLAVQVAHTTLLDGITTSVTGSVLSYKNRLVTRVLSVRIAESLLGLVSLFALVMIFYTSRNGVVPRDPDSVGGLAVLLSKSKRVKSLLSGTGSSSEDRIREIIGHLDFMTVMEPGEDGQNRFEIQPNDDSRALNVFPSKEQWLFRTKDKKSITWWHPFGASILARAIALITIIVVIIMLEVLLQLSRRHNGLASVDSNGYTHYVWSYVPALVMVGIGLLFGTLDTSAKTFAPFSRLRHGKARSQDLFLNFLGKTAFESIWLSTKTRHFSVLATTLAVVVSSYLTIVVSGVYTVMSVSSSEPVNLKFNSWFNSSDKSDSGMDQNTVILSSLVTVGNLSYPKWTFAELSFPEVELVSSEVTDMISKSTEVVAEVPAIRTKLNCTLYQGIESLKPSLIWGPVQFEPDNPLTVPVPIPIPIPPGSFGCGSGQTLIISAQRNSTFAQTSDPVGSYPCPHLTYLWGNIGPTEIEHIAALTCYENMEQVSVKTTFNLPDLSISITQPPVADESTATYFSPTVLISIYDFLPNITVTDTMTTIIDNFFDVLIAGNNGISISDLANDTAAVAISNAIQHLHKVIRTQQYQSVASPSTTFRIPPPESMTSAFTGTATNPNRLRLVQAVVSTRILEALLAIMGICIIFQTFLMDMKEVLPKNPGSVAAMASLLADSRILDEGVIPDGASWFEREKLEGNDVFGKFLYRMGWWEINPRADESQRLLKEAKVPKKASFGVDVLTSVDVEAERG